ncbi:hypothetical protein Q4S00_14150, partial [Morganella morganii]
ICATEKTDSSPCCSSHNFYGCFILKYGEQIMHLEHLIFIIIPAAAFIIGFVVGGFGIIDF